MLSVSSDSPLRLNASNSSYYFSPALFFLPSENQLKHFLAFFFTYKSLLVSVLISEMVLRRSLFLALHVQYVGKLLCMYS